MKKQQVIDFSQALEQSAGNEQLAKELFQMLLSELPVLLKNLKSALRCGDLSESWDHAHKIYGSTAYCGVPGLRKAAAQLESSIKGNHADKLQSDSQELEWEVNRLLEEGPALLEVTWASS